MKNLLYTLCLALLVLWPGTAFGADALFRMLHADQVPSFQKDQDAFIVGQLTGRQGDKFIVKVLKVLNGKINSGTIQVSGDFLYFGQQDNSMPNINDFCVMSLKKIGDYYTKAWGIYKADSGDYRTLKLIPNGPAGQGMFGELACINWYVNSGGTESNFFFNGANAFVRRPSGQTLQIYPDMAQQRAANTNITETPENAVSAAELQSEVYTLKSRVNGLEAELRTRKDYFKPAIILILCLFGFVSALWAKNTGRNPWFWLFAGILINVLTPLILLSQKSVDKPFINSDGK